MESRAEAIQADEKLKVYGRLRYNGVAIMVENVIQTNSLTKAYGPHIALDSMNLKVQQGATGLLGPNGAGKSTLIKTLLGLITVSDGEGEVLGYNIRTEGEEIRKRIGYMPEYDCLDPRLSAVDQIKYSGELLGMNPSVATQRAHEVLEYVGLRDQRYREIGTFSTGMAQAAKLATSIIHDPQLLIADEPTNGLDTQARDFMLGTVTQIVQEGGRSMLMASHLMEDVEKVCSRIVMLHKGKLIAQGRIEDLKGIDQEIEVHAWGGATKLEQELNDSGLKVRRTGRVLRIIKDDDAAYSTIIEAATKTGCQIRRMHDHEPSLEDLFLVIMERLGYEVKSSEDLFATGPSARKVDAPEELKG
jgi:ABC-2 type transport system ATP-binding protein